MDPNVKFIVCKDYDEISKKAADILQEQINNKGDSNICFATGSSPIGMYKEMIKRHEEGKVDFSKITAFNLDEYFPIKKDNPQSYDYYMRENLFDHVNINMENRFIPNGETKDGEKECKDYDNLISEKGGFDFQILGIGTNAHIGFNEPADTLPAESNVVDLAQATIDANARFFDNLEDVPKEALTIGLRPIIQSKKAILIASGEAKAEAIYNSFFKDITTQVPGSFLQLHKDITVIVDEAAYKLIKENN